MVTVRWVYMVVPTSEMLDISTVLETQYRESVKEGEDWKHDLPTTGAQVARNIAYVKKHLASYWCGLPDPRILNASAKDTFHKWARSHAMDSLLDQATRKSKLGPAGIVLLHSLRRVHLLVGSNLLLFSLSDFGLAGYIQCRQIYTPAIFCIRIRYSKYANRLLNLIRR